jgi:hypothetical protein
MPSSKREFLTQALNKLAEDGIKPEYAFNQVSEQLNRMILREKRKAFDKMGKNQKEIIGKVNFNVVTPEDDQYLDRVDKFETMNKYFILNTNQDSIRTRKREIPRPELAHLAKLQGMQKNMNARIVKE